MTFVAQDPQDKEPLRPGQGNKLRDGLAFRDPNAGGSVREWRRPSVNSPPFGAIVCLEEPLRLESVLPAGVALQYTPQGWQVLTEVQAISQMREYLQPKQTTPADVQEARETAALGVAAIGHRARDLVPLLKETARATPQSLAALYCAQAVARIGDQTALAELKEAGLSTVELTPEVWDGETVRIQIVTKTADKDCKVPELRDRTELWVLGLPMEGKIDAADFSLVSPTRPTVACQGFLLMERAVSVTGDEFWTRASVIGDSKPFCVASASYFDPATGRGGITVFTSGRYMSAIIPKHKCLRLDLLFSGVHPNAKLAFRGKTVPADYREEDPK